MKFNKYKAFTLAEVMILLLTLSVLMAAFAPIMTKRQHNVSIDDVWTYVPSDSDNDAYFDATNNSYTAQAFMGIPVKKALDVSTSSQDGNSNPLYSKLVIRSGSKVKVDGFSGQPQSQMQFRYGNSSTGTRLGTLFAGRGNFLLGGTYDNIQPADAESSTSKAIGNTAYGYQALTALTTGAKNTAVGYLALNELKTGSYNTAVGSRAGRYTTGSRNTFMGQAAGAYVTSGVDNTIVGLISAPHKTTTGSGNTLMGTWDTYSDHEYNLTSGSGNTAVGYSALHNNKTGSYNTAVGFKSLENVTTGSYNTAIGYNTGNLLSTGSYKTFVGAFSGTKQTDDKVPPHSGLYTDNHERVFIGAIPKSSVAKNDGPGAVLEVHNINAKDSGANVYPLTGFGYESVVVNGNLIVRGQSYFETPIIRPTTLVNAVTMEKLPKGLVAYKVDTVVGNYKGFMGYDGASRNEKSLQSCNGCRSHDYKDLRSNCICTTVGSYSGNTDYAVKSSNPNRVGSTSYDWITPSSVNGNENAIDGDGCGAKLRMGASYTDGVTNEKITFERSNSGDNDKRGTDQPFAHLKGAGKSSDYGTVYSSCCPNLTTGSATDTVGSDARLKNIGEIFTAGLAELKRLNIYNYTFKNDVRKIPQVGVIAQDLKMVFPNAVSKDENGYYHIRWDEMLYAVINSVKDLNTRIEKLASKISNDKSRVAVLKKDNQELNAKLDKLESELSALEAKKH